MVLDKATQTFTSRNHRFAVFAFYYFGGEVFIEVLLGVFAVLEVFF